MALRVFSHDPGSFGGHLNQTPDPGQWPLGKASADPANHLQQRWHRGPVLLDVIQPGCSLGQASWGGGSGCPSLGRNGELEGRGARGVRAQKDLTRQSGCSAHSHPCWAQDCHRAWNRALEVGGVRGEGAQWHPHHRLSPD